MGLFDNLSKMAGLADKIGNYVEDLTETVLDKTAAAPESAPAYGTTGNVQMEETIVLASCSRMVKEEAYGADDSRYLISFEVNDAFKSADSHAGEIEMLNTYAPAEEYGEEGAVPYLAVQLDDPVYLAVEEFKKTGTFTGAIEITALSGNFYFKAKKEYYNYMMYFYGMDRCGGFWQNNGLCMVYPKAYAGTEKERKLMQVLDEAAESYREERMA